MQFNAQHQDAADHCPRASCDIMVRANVPARRLYDRDGKSVRIVGAKLALGHRKQCIGSALSCSLLDEGTRSRRTASIHLETYIPAMRLYRQLGFSSRGTGCLPAYAPCVPIAPVQSSRVFVSIDVLSRHSRQAASIETGAESVR